MAGKNRILIYLLRRDLRLADNPVLTEICRVWGQGKAPFTHVLPIYVFPAQQIEVSGFLDSHESDNNSHARSRSPYPEARSAVGGFWRCGPHRAKFIAESIWDLKRSLEDVGSGLAIRVGTQADVLKDLLVAFKQGNRPQQSEKNRSGAESTSNSSDGDADRITAVWMTEEPGIEEKREERAVRGVLDGEDTELRIFRDEKYYIDDRDLPFSDAQELPDIFTSFRKQVEPLREAPRPVLATPTSLPPLPPHVPHQAKPFSVPSSLEDIIKALHKPLDASLGLPSPPRSPGGPNPPSSAHPFTGGSRTGMQRIDHLLSSGAMTSYKDTRNGLLGTDFSTKLSAWLALGCITARQVHSAMLEYEDGHAEQYKGCPGYGKGENKGTAAVRFELLWRDYFRLITRKFGPRMFRASGFRADESIKWGYDKHKLGRWLDGTTGMGLVDAAQRELFLTGYTSNRTRQNVASFLSKHLYLDWRLGAEWYECCLIDYDVGSNWGNWQYNSGVGNDPREGGIGRKFNPVKQAFDYDPEAAYVKAWVDEVREVDSPGEAFQYSDNPLVRIDFKHRKGGGGGGSGGGRGGRGGGGGGGGSGSRGGRGKQHKKNSKPGNLD